MSLGAHHEDAEKYLDDLLAHERQRPREHVHVVRQHERVLRVVILLDFDLVVLESQDRRLVVVHIAIVRRREDSDDTGELGRSVPLVELVAVHLYLVGPHDAEEVVGLEEIVSGAISEEVGAAAFCVLGKCFL